MLLVNTRQTSGQRIWRRDAAVAPDIEHHLA
jgi:hypothetical protein